MISGLTLAMMLTARGASAQTSAVGEMAAANVEPLPPRAAAPPRVEMYETLTLKNMTEQREMNDVMTDLRNMLSRARIYGVTSRGSISVWGTQEEIELARKIVAEMDQPAKEYKLTFTITETDGAKQTGAQHLSMTILPGARTVMKQGSRVPIVTGSYKEGSGDANTQVQYLDVGLSIEANLDGTSLHTKVEQTSPSNEPSGMGAKDPVVRQSVLDGTTNLTPGKSLVLGSLDIPGSTRRQEVELAVETAQ
jgi:type II secretory pathway component GspD/PulD (secretin)